MGQHERIQRLAEFRQIAGLRREGRKLFRRAERLGDHPAASHGVKQLVRRIV